MSSLIQIKYGVDSNGNVLSLSVNPKTVGSYKTTNRTFSIFLNGIDPLESVPLSSGQKFQTKLEFYAVTGSTGSTGAGNYMESLWNNSVFSSNFLSTVDFQNPGFLLSQTVLTS